MEIWIEGGRGLKQGPGPITTATGWTQTDRLNAAGEFSFSMPALDPRAALVRRGYFARAWQFEEPGGWREVGYGRIEQMAMSAGPDGAPMLTVSGPNELGLLVDRLCVNLSLRREVQEHPAEVYQWDSDPSAYTQQWGVYDYAIGDTSTYDTLSTFNADEYLVIRSTHIFHKISVVIDATSPHANTSSFTATYYNGSTWAGVTIVDGTSVGGVAFKQSGDITLEPPSDWTIEPGKVLYELRLLSPGALTTCRVDDISIWYYEGSLTALADVMAYAPAGWSLDTATGYDVVGDRTLGAELVAHGTFDAIAVVDVADNPVTDTLTGWTNDNIDDANGRSVLAVTTSHSDTYGVKITSDSGVYAVNLYQDVTVTPGLQYTLAFWAKGDGGVGQILCVCSDQTSGGSGQELLSYDTMTTAATWTQHTIELNIPAGLTTLRLAFYLHYNTANPATAYLDDVSLKPGGGSPVYLQLRDETVFEALRRIASATNENFLRSPAGRAVLWLGADVRDSGLRAIAADPAAGASAENVLLLTDLQEVIDTSGLVSRVYPSGGGMGAHRVTLAQVTQPAPTGYVLDKANNYLERTAAVAALGVIETAQQWSDISPLNSSETQEQYAANALMWQAWEYLETHSATDLDNVLGDVPRFYRATCVKSEAMVLPGYTLRLSYHRFRDGLHAINIDRDVWITAVTQSVGGDGVGVVGLELATVPRAAESDGLLVARNLMRLRNALAHNSAEAY